MNDVTIITKTMYRPQSLLRLVKSIRTYYPTVMVLIGEDTGEYLPVESDQYTKIIHLPKDVGVSEGRNALVRRVNTKYTVVLDDDFEFISNTDLNKFKTCIDSLSLDLVAGWLMLVVPTDNLGVVQRHEGMLNIREGILFCEKGYKAEHVLDYRDSKISCREVDITLQFFMALTDSLESTPWDTQFKVAGEHHDFFLRAKDILKVGVCQQVLALHHPHFPPEYKKYKIQSHDYIRRLLSKHGLQRIEFTPPSAWI